jgi:hypothetical protein
MRWFGLSLEARADERGAAENEHGRDTEIEVPEKLLGRNRHGALLVTGM